MQNVSINAALIVVLSAVFESLPPGSRGKARDLMNHMVTTGRVTDRDAAALIGTFANTDHN